MKKHCIHCDDVIGESRGDSVGVACIECYREITQGIIPQGSVHICGSTQHPQDRAEMDTDAFGASWKQA